MHLVHMYTNLLFSAAHQVTLLFVLVNEGNLGTLQKKQLLMENKQNVRKETNKNKK